MKKSARSCVVAATFVAAIATVNQAPAQTMVGTATDLQNAINSGATNIELTAPIVLTTPINIGTTSSPTITINGNGNSITDTGGTSEDFFIQSGNITIKNTSLTGTAYGGNGGAGLLTGGGALGAGGAIFVGATANVTASNVQFTGNTAGGGTAATPTITGSGGGGGINGGAGGTADTNGGVTDINGGAGGGGNGGAGGAGNFGQGGGGGGLNSAGGLGAVTGGNGGGPNGGAGGIAAAGGTGGANSGGGGGGSGFNGGNAGTNGGGGGGGNGANGGNGGSYGGGGGGTSGGSAGFGGGGGGGYANGGAGGFGGGGGGSIIAGGTGGTGAGAGNTTTTGQGGGGAGLGGAVFVQAGGSFVVTGSGTFTNNTVAQGIGFVNGAAVGKDLFIMSGATTTLAPGTGNTITVADTIADDSAASLPAGNGYSPGTAAGAALTIGSSAARGGTVALNSDNTYSGGTTITNGATLQVGSAGALGSGLASVNSGTLTVGNGNHNIVAGTYAQMAGGTLLLGVAGAGAAASNDELIITNPTASGATLGGTLKINFAGFTIPAGSPHSFDFTVVQTNTGYTDTFTGLQTVDLPGGATARILYTNPDDVLLQINLVTAISVAGLTPNEQAPLGAINTALARGVPNAALGRLSVALSALSGSPAIGGAAQQLIPLKFNNFASVTAFNDESFEVQEMDTYLAGQRGARGTFLGGSGQLDTSALTINDPNVDPGLRMIHSRMLAWNEPSAAMTDVPSAVLGGVDMKDMKSCSACGEPSNPWNVFVRGTLILAQGFSQPDQPHFDDNTESVAIGADYRFTSNFLVGLTAGYAHTDATLDTANSSATVDSYSPGIYASYVDKGWYANAIGRYSYNSYTEDRRISFLGQSADGATDGNEGMADLDGGYDFHAGAWTFGPFAGLQYTHLTVNSYQEGGSVANLAVDEDQSDSLRSRLGGNLRYDFRGCGVIFTPHLTASWQHEFLDPSRGITSQFTTFTSGSFVVRTENPSDDSALVDAGLDAKIDGWITVFGDYLVQAGQSDYFGQAIEAGVKFNF